MTLNLKSLARCLAVLITCLQPIAGLDNDYFFTHLLRNLKNDILNLKPGSSKTYIINSKLLGRNDIKSIELDIKSRAKEMHDQGMHKVHHKEQVKIFDSKKEEQHVTHNSSQSDLKGREELKQKIRRALIREFKKIQGKHKLKIRKIMKHKGHSHARKKIRVKVLRKHKTDETTEPVTNSMEEKDQTKSKEKKVKSVKILHVPVLKLKKNHRGRKIMNGKSKLDEYGIDQNDDDDSDFEEGGQLPELFAGEDLDGQQLSALFRNTKDLDVYVVTNSPTTTPTTTTTEPSTKNVKDEYTYEYVYEDELEKDKELKRFKNKDEKKKGATDDEYTYEYIYEDEMKKNRATPLLTTPRTTRTTTTTPTTTPHVSKESEESEENASKVHKPVIFSPSVEKEVQELRELERNCTQRTTDPDLYYGDSNSQYKQPERFMYDSDCEPQDDSQYPTDYDWNCPAITTKAQTFRIAASSIMYDDEDTKEFLAHRNKTKMERGYDSYPADVIFTCDVKHLKHRYTRPKLTPEWYDSLDEYIDHWGGEWEDNLQGNPSSKHRRNKTTMGGIGHTTPYSPTERRRYNVTLKEPMEFKFDLDELLKNTTNLWMKNITQSTTPRAEEETTLFITIDDINKYGIPEFVPERKIRRMKRDIGGGMKIPRRQWEVLMYLAQKVNHTRWIARLKKMRAAPNLMELLIKRDKKKENKKSIVYKQKAIKPKKRPKGPKRIVFKKRKPKDNRRMIRVKLGAQRRQKKQQRKRRSVNNMNIIEHENQLNYIDIKAFDDKVDKQREKRDLEDVEVKLIRKKRKVVEKLSDDLLFDFEQNPETIHGTVENMTDIYQANLLETHKLSIDKAMDLAIEKFESKNVTTFNKTDEIEVYKTFICEYKQMMEEWFVSMFFDVPNAIRRYAKKHIFKLRKDRVPSNVQVNKFFEYDNYLTIRLEMTEKVIRTTMKHFYDELEDKVFGYFYGFEKAQKLFDDPYKGLNRTTLSDQDLMRLLAQTTQYDPDLKKKEMKEAEERLRGPTDRYGNTLQPLPDPRWR